MIILEGLDATGKTTLANALAARLASSVIHSSKPKLEMGWIEYHVRSMAMEPAILDRYHIGEAVWPVIFNDGRKPMLRWQQHMVERIMLQRGAILVLLNDSHEVINQRLKLRGENEISLEQYTETYSLFRDACEHSLLSTIFINNASWEQRDILDLISSAYTRVQMNRQPIARFRGTGTVKPGSIMIVGEKNPSGLNILDNTYAPLCCLTDRVLQTALHLSGQSDFYLTYFKKIGNRRSDRHALMTEQGLLQPRKIICVDNESYTECKALFPGLNISLVELKSNPHQYAKFFK
jgi:thymidylate kinase